MSTTHSKRRMSFHPATSTTDRTGSLTGKHRSHTTQRPRLAPSAPGSNKAFSACRVWLSLSQSNDKSLNGQRATEPTGRKDKGPSRCDPRPRAGRPVSGAPCGLVAFGLVVPLTRVFFSGWLGFWTEEVEATVIPNLMTLPQEVKRNIQGCYFSGSGVLCGLICPPSSSSSFLPLRA